MESAVASRGFELHEVLASHKAVQQAKDLAKANLAAVEQQLLADRAARDAQLQQHTSLVSVHFLLTFLPAVVAHTR